MRIPHFLALSLAAANIASAQLVVSHMSASTANPTNQPKPYLKIENQGGTAVDLSKITLDYLIFESGLQPTALVADCWYVSSGACPDLTAEFASTPLQDDGTRKANLRIRIGFTRGSLAAGQELIIQWGYHEQAFQRQFNETDDWSFTQANSQWNVDIRVAVGSNGTGSAGTAMVWKGLVPGLPSTGKAGDVVHSQAQNASFVYDGTSWVLVSEIGKEGPQGAQGVAGPAGAAGAPGATGAVGPKGEKGDAGSGDNAELLKLITDLTARVGRIEGGATNPNEFIDYRDNKTYKTVMIGGKRWMAQNLNYGGEDNGIGHCFGNDNANCTKYGRQYDWATLMALPANCNSNSTTCAQFVQAKHKGICPEGWHVPTTAEWSELITFVGEDNNGAWAGKEGTALRSTTGWNEDGNGSDAFGFRALPAGNGIGGTSSIGIRGNWWSATEQNGTCAWIKILIYSYADMRSACYGRTSAFSARCLEN